MKTLFHAFGISLFFLGCQSDQEWIHPQKKEIIESVYASSKILSENQYEHRLEVSARLLEYRVKEGDAVKAGEVIALLRSNQAKSNLKSAEAQLGSARASKEQLQELSYQIETARLQMVQDSIDFERQQSLFNQSIGSRSNLEARRLKMVASKNQYRALQKRFNYSRAQINAGLTQAKLNLELAKDNSSLFVVTALNDGRVFSLPSEIGELINPQQVFAIIGDEKNFIVQMEIDERDISDIELGQEVIVKMDAYPDTYRASVSKIIPTLNARTQTFLAEAVFTDSIPALFPGLTAESNIILNRKKNALVIPKRVLLSPNTVETQDGVIELGVGLSNNEWVEVLSGITESDKILTPNQ